MATVDTPDEQGEPMKPDSIESLKAAIEAMSSHVKLQDVINTSGVEVPQTGDKIKCNPFIEIGKIVGAIRAAKAASFVLNSTSFFSTTTNSNRSTFFPSSFFGNNTNRFGTFFNNFSGFFSTTASKNRSRFFSTTGETLFQGRFFSTTRNRCTTTANVSNF